MIDICDGTILKAKLNKFILENDANKDGRNCFRTPQMSLNSKIKPGSAINKLFKKRTQWCDQKQ